MEETKVEDMLIEMISPKVKEIEEKFSQGKGLSQDDINTLLLKSQYNHINHLDKKLDETVDLVYSIKNEFDVKFNNLKNEFDVKFNNLKNEFDVKFAQLQGEFNTLRGEFNTFKAEIIASNEETKRQIQETINNTMKWYIGGAGIIIVALKALDIFIK